MSSTIEEIKKQVMLANISNSRCKSRPVGCPMQNNCIDEIQLLSKHQFHAAFLLGLIGNARNIGSIIINSKKKYLSDNQ